MIFVVKVNLYNSENAAPWILFSTYKYQIPLISEDNKQEIALSELCQCCVN